jgi:hypothetical protein
MHFRLGASSFQNRQSYFSRPGVNGGGMGHPSLDHGDGDEWQQDSRPSKLQKTAHSPERDGSLFGSSAAASFLQQLSLENLRHGGLQ